MARAMDDAGATGKILTFDVLPHDALRGNIHPVQRVFLRTPDWALTDRGWCISDVDALDTRLRNHVHHFGSIGPASTNGPP